MAEVDPKILYIDQHRRGLQPPTGGDNSGGMDPWQQSVETRLGGLQDDVRGLRDALERDFRILFGAIIAVALGLASLMAKGFGWL